MKKLNRKGFTLIELLAVIVIMAIILVVTVPNIIQSINDARVSSLHNLAVSVANTYDNLFAQDLIASESNKILGDIPDKISDEWQCIDDLWMRKNNDIINLCDILGLNDVDITIINNDYLPVDDLNANVTIDGVTKTGYEHITFEYCSSIRMKDGKAEVLLVAAPGGKFYVSQYHTFALSSDPSARQNPA